MRPRRLLHPKLRTSQVKDTAADSGQKETSRASTDCVFRCNPISTQPTRYNGKVILKFPRLFILAVQ
jgi:trans-aconitate methyltransferase